MPSGTLVADRFEIEHRAGLGGMGIVFRAYDRFTKRPVALKVLLAESQPRDLERFAREAQLLAGLRHPGVVTYVAHGHTQEGWPYLAMEWLEGEDLSRRLRHQPLTVAESVTLVRAVAEALAAVHRHGVVHRDIKPSNLFLRDGQVERATLIDFGIARGGSVSWSVTRTGEVVGTLQYIAPEQARGGEEVKPRADVFALGCVLYECLTGTPPFPGKNQAAVLVRVLLEEVSPLRDLRPDLPAALDELLGRMLAKDPAARLVDGNALWTALANLALPASWPTSTPKPSPRGQWLAEQGLMNLILALPRPSVSDQTVTIRLTENDPSTAARRADLERALAPLGGRIDHLAGGATLVTRSGPGYVAADQVLQAAQAALLMRRHLPEMMVALVTGQGLLVEEGMEEGTEEGTIGRASQLILEASDMSDLGPAGDPLPVLLDKRTAALIDTRFDVRQVKRDLFVLEGKRTGPREMRRLLGRLTPFVGRVPDLQLLEMAGGECFEEASAQAVLVLGEPGMGKSRLRYEFLRRMEERGDPLEVLLGQGDPLRTDTAYSLLVDMFSRLCGMEEDMDVMERRARLTARAVKHVPEREHRRVVEFLGELCGLSFPDEDSPQLKAARQDARLMLDQVTAAFVTFLRAECAARPVLLVLEDLHWGDMSTVQLVSVALRELAEAPLLVLGLARPEVKDRFPRLWENRSVQEIRLTGLSDRASERLVRVMLEERATEETVARIVGQARGHVLFLEELIRAVAEGQEELPETVLAILQTRFLRLDPEARQTLRAASIFGETFWCGGVKEILGLQGEDLDGCLEPLVHAEMIVRQEVSRFAGDQQFMFRHALVRDAAYSLLGEEDRRLGHRLVGAYLERAGERDALVLAEHYERGGERPRAALFLARAARQALATDHADGAMRLVTRGVACGADGELLGTLRSIGAWAEFWFGNLQASYESAQAAIELLPRGSPDWILAQGAAVARSNFGGHREHLQAHIEVLTTAPLAPGTESAFMEPAMWAVAGASLLGMLEPATLFLARAQEVAERLGRHDPRARGMLAHAVSFHGLIEGDLWRYRTAGEVAAGYFAEAADRRWLYAARTYMGVGLLLIGEIEHGRTVCREALEQVTLLAEPLGRLATQALFAFALAETGGPEHRSEARDLAVEVVDDPLMPGFWSGMTCVALATVRADTGAWEAAEQVARQAFQGFAGAPAGKPLGCAVLGRILLEQGRLEEASMVVAEGLTQLEAQGGQGLYDTKLHLVAAELWHAFGQEEKARAARVEAERSLARCTARIPDPTARQRFLDHSREHARLRALRTPPSPV